MLPICFFFSFEFVQSHPICATKSPLMAGFLRGAKDEPLEIVDSHVFARGGAKKTMRAQSRAPIRRRSFQGAAEEDPALFAV